MPKLNEPEDTTATPSGRECRACRSGLPKRGRRRCPECGHVFRGHGWDGIDAHWRARHLDVMPYEKLWATLCPAHRAADVLECPSCQKGIPRAGPRQCPECALVLRGKGWAGIEAHWQAHHVDVMSYEEFWTSLCPAHRGDDDGMPFLPFDPPRSARRSRG
jgi:predicted amidophosphoribosyltransferase